MLGGQNMKYIVKKDKYTKAREGTAKFNILSCAKCHHEIFIYQKDGPGRLLRLYLDKFVAPHSIVEEVKNITTKNEMHGLKCPSCGELLGVPMVYEKENRLAYRLLSNKVIRREEQSPLEYEL